MRPGDICGRLRRQPRENGQATVEFALILLPLLLLVVGIIQFGIALNFWLDMQRIANQGARWAAVNHWPPACPRGSASCGSWPGTPANTLQQHLHDQAISQGLEDSVAVEICYPSSSGSSTEVTGQPVRVRLQAPFDLLPILGWGSLNLRADATMRLEQSQATGEGLITGEVSC